VIKVASVYDADDFGIWTIQYCRRHFQDPRVRVGLRVRVRVRVSFRVSYCKMIQGYLHIVRIAKLPVTSTKVIFSASFLIVTVISRRR